MNERQSLLDRLTGPPAPDDDPRAAQFVRGLALGALVGAAIAGTALIQRRRAASEQASGGESAGEAPPASDATSVTGGR